MVKNITSRWLCSTILRSVPGRAVFWPIRLLRRHENTNCRTEPLDRRAERFQNPSTAPLLNGYRSVDTANPRAIFLTNAHVDILPGPSGAARHGSLFLQPANSPLQKDDCFWIRECRIRARPAQHAGACFTRRRNSTSVKRPRRGRYRHSCWIETLQLTRSFRPQNLRRHPC